MLWNIWHKSVSIGRVLEKYLYVIICDQKCVLMYFQKKSTISTLFHSLFLSLSISYNFSISLFEYFSLSISLFLFGSLSLSLIFSLLSVYSPSLSISSHSSLSRFSIFLFFLSIYSYFCANKVNGTQHRKITQNFAIITSNWCKNKTFYCTWWFLGNLALLD